MATDSESPFDTEYEDRVEGAVDNPGDVEEMGNGGVQDQARQVSRKQARDTAAVAKRRTKAERDAIPKAKSRRAKQPVAAAGKSVSPSKPRGAKASKPPKPVKIDVKAREVAARRAANSLKQVSDPTRLFVLLTLAHGEMNVGSICKLLNQSQPATSHHLALMRHGRLINPRRDGKNNFYSLTDEGRTLAEIVQPFVDGIVR